MQTEQLKIALSNIVTLARSRAHTRLPTRRAAHLFAALMISVSQPRSHPARAGGCDLLASAARIVHLNKSQWPPPPTADRTE
jgi:hypothetical protein